METVLIDVDVINPYNKLIFQWKLHYTELMSNFKFQLTSAFICYRSVLSQNFLQLYDIAGYQKQEEERGKVNKKSKTSYQIDYPARNRYKLLIFNSLGQEN